VEEVSIISIPLLNPNEREVSITAIHIKEGQHVQSGQLICTIETTKSTADIEADQNGFILNFQFGIGDTASAGDILCYIADNPDWNPETDEASKVHMFSNGEVIDFDFSIPDGLKITIPALETAKANKINLKNLPRDQLITREFLTEKFQVHEHSLDNYEKGMKLISQLSIPEGDGINSIIIYGGGGLGKTLIELLQAMGGYSLIGIIDDGIEPGTKILNIPVLGSKEHLDELHKRGITQAINAVGGIGEVSVRSRVFKTLINSHYSFPSVTHPTAFIEKSAIIASGVQVFAKAYIGTDVQIGFGCIVNTGSIVSHDCILGEQVNISPGTTLAGEVIVGNQVLIGMGVTVNLGIQIGEFARIGNGSTIKANVPTKTIVKAGTTWPDF